ncbi:MAG: hypothetical protein K2O59_15555 [Lachnospiraceae bacterium]|nr:hypothetical protein [Lachnospiraceae bacterium]
MKFWTTQTEKVIKYILDDNVYNPDFNLSDGLGSKDMKGGYDEILKEYQHRNHVECEGLIFGITQLEDVSVESIEQYREYFTKNTTFWDSVSYAGENYAILELEIPDKIDVIPIYFQDFIILSMRSIKDIEFQLYVKQELKSIEFQDFKADLEIAQSKGWTNDEKDFLGESMLNRITQAHIHKISKDYIVGVHETFDFENEIQYSLGKEAKKLYQHVNMK